MHGSRDIVPVPLEKGRIPSVSPKLGFFRVNYIMRNDIDI
jgi:hypothetical protein